MLALAAALTACGGKPAETAAPAEAAPKAADAANASSPAALPQGWLVQRYGRKALMTTFFLGTGASLIAAGFAGSPLVLAVTLAAAGGFSARKQVPGEKAEEAGGRSARDAAADQRQEDQGNQQGRSERRTAEGHTAEGREAGAVSRPVQKSQLTQGLLSAPAIIRPA